MRTGQPVLPPISASLGQHHLPRKLEEERMRIEEALITLMFYIKDQVLVWNFGQVLEHQNLCVLSGLRVVRIILTVTERAN